MHNDRRGRGPLPLPKVRPPGTPCPKRDSRRWLSPGTLDPLARVAFGDPCTALVLQFGRERFAVSHAGAAHGRRLGRADNAQTAVATQRCSREAASRCAGSSRVLLMRSVMLPASGRRHHASVDYNRRGSKPASGRERASRKRSAAMSARGDGFLGQRRSGQCGRRSQ